MHSVDGFQLNNYGILDEQVYSQASAHLYSVVKDIDGFLLNDAKPALHQFVSEAFSVDAF